ncbi:MAG: hypothetical protein Q4E38_08080 [Eubacteriales bacterium]|nr:hypothetical protein [Eubacteriales bacterium]
MTEAMREALGEKPVTPGESVSAGIPRESEGTEATVGQSASGGRIATSVTRSLVRHDKGEEPERKEGADAAFSPTLNEGGGNRAERVPSDALRAHFASLVAQGEALREELPGFDLDAALHDPAFLRLTAPGLGVGVREAWCALHREAFEERAARRGAEEAKALLARTAAQGALRPREGGGLDAAALTRSDPRALSHSARERLREEIRAAAARGEKLYP